MKACISYLLIAFLFTMKWLSAESEDGRKIEWLETHWSFDKITVRGLGLFFSPWFLVSISVLEIHSLDFKFRLCAWVLSHFNCVWLWNPMDCSPPGNLSMGFSRQEHWSELPCPLPGDLLKPKIQTTSLCLLHWQAGSLPLAPPGRRRQWHPTPVLLPAKSKGQREEPGGLQCVGSRRVGHD